MFLLYEWAEKIDYFFALLSLKECSLCLWFPFKWKLPFHLLHCCSAFKPPCLAVIEKSDTGKCFYWFHLLLRPLDPTFRNAAKWLFWRGLKMEITFFAFQEWPAKDFPNELICFHVLCKALFCLVLNQTRLWWHKHILVPNLKSLVEWGHLSFLVGV